VFQVMLGLFDFGMGPTIVKEFSKDRKSTRLNSSHKSRLI
jgi:hypothetical protein